MRADQREGSMSASPATIHEKAEKLLRAAGIDREPIDLRDVVSALNLGLVHSAHEPFSPEASLVPCGDTHAIVLRGTGDERRRRFTIAHEIGHFVLHPRRVAPERGGAVNEAMKIQEREADRFAAELLMPEHLVRKAVQDEGADVRRLAERFEVNEQAMSVRLRRLGLATRQCELLPPSRDLL
jgi:predicted transcriptional regulator